MNKATSAVINNNDDDDDDDKVCCIMIVSWLCVNKVGLNKHNLSTWYQKNLKALIVDHIIPKMNYVLKSYAPSSKTYVCELCIAVINGYPLALLKEWSISRNAKFKLKQQVIGLTKQEITINSTLLNLNAMLQGLSPLKFI